jgi:methylmalonyl-CoA/ethylmalonyl-CoA epimerase
VEDVSSALEALRAQGVKLVDETPRKGAHGTEVAFVHPKSTFGVLTELVSGGRKEQGA